MASSDTACGDTEIASKKSSCASVSKCSCDKGPLAHFHNMLGNCLEFARTAHSQGRPIVGILCEFTPRELIMAAGGVPVCLCGGSAETIPAAERDLPAGLCPLIKSTYGYHVMGSNPFLEMADLIVGETTCDGKKKMYELMGEKRPMYVLELPQKEQDPDAFAHWHAELRKFKRFLESRYGNAITEAKLDGAIRVMNRERALRRDIAALMKAERPPLTGRHILELKSSISGIDEDLGQYEKALALYSGKEGCPETANRVRVLMTGVPIVHGAERVLDLVEAHGGLVVCAENCSGVKPVLEDVDDSGSDPLRAIAQKYFHLPCSVMTGNQGRLESLRRLAGEFRAECIVELVWQGCLTYDVESVRIKRFCEQELGLSYLRIETDYSPSDYARIAVRIEALFETVRAKALTCG